jgi:D-aminopeptidase
LSRRDVRARDLGLQFDGDPGDFNAITDVPAVEVGHATIVSGDGAKAVRTGVTAVLPRGREGVWEPLFAAWFSMNGCGEMTGTTWVQESGFLYGPVLTTNSHSVGVVRDSVIEWEIQRGLDPPYALPVVAETWDGYLNDMNGMHVRKEHTFAAINSATSGPVEEGNVGGGTGMICYEFKGGIGTASRKVRLAPRGTGYSVGVLVQANHGSRPQFRINGVPVGLEITENRVYQEGGSIIVIIGTDAPLLPHQLKRIAQRASMGLAKTGSFASNYSGDIFLAFSTSNRGSPKDRELLPKPPDPAPLDVRMLPNGYLDTLFEATVQATDEAILNALVRAKTMVGFEDHRVMELPHDRLREIMLKHRRFA